MASITRRTGTEKKVVVIGGGPAGLTASYMLSQAGIPSLVLEKDNIVGGISRTVNFKDYRFDIGGHRFFTKIPEVEKFWKDVLGPDFLRRKRLSRIFYNRKFFYYPLKPFNALLGLGIGNCFLVGGSYILARIFPSKNEETFEEWVSNRFGKRLYNIFFKTYTEKVWGIPCNEIRAEWAAQRIKGLSLTSAVKNALIKPRNGDRNGVIKTLIDEFDYPKFGPGMMWEAVADRIRENGSEVWLGAEVVGIRTSNGAVTALEVKRNGKTELVAGTDFISSMPIREAVRKFKPAVSREFLDAAGSLNYRDFLTVALVIDKAEMFPDNWIYIHDPQVKVGRIQNFKNWSPHMVPTPDKTCVGLEYFCFEGDELWNTPDDRLVEYAKDELEALGFAKKADVEDGTVVRMPKAYPVYDAVYKESLNDVRKFLDGIPNFQLVGRNGQHKYNNQDHSMLTAMLAAENVQGARHDLWQVNGDPEYQEEVFKKIIMRAFARIDKLGFATALGLVAGMLFFIVNTILALGGGNEATQYLGLLGQYFIGYTVSFEGTLVGTAYVVWWTFLFGWLFAYLRNLFLAFYLYRVKRRTEMLTFMNFIDHY
jgi:protoporphyrinogen oxidase